jgi:hypothetical protein
MNEQNVRPIFGKITRSLDPYKLKLDELQERIHFENHRGEIFTYAFFEEALGLKRQDSRFKSVMGGTYAGWRRFMRVHHGIIFIALANEGYRIIEEGEQVKYVAQRRFRPAGRLLRAGKEDLTSAIATGKLNQRDRANADFLCTVISNTASQLRDARLIAEKQAEAPKKLPAKVNNG